jgi:large subunit ribosomal protein L22
MTGPKTNERPGTRAIHRHARVAPNKVREVLDLIRNKPVADALDILRFSERDPALLVAKVLQSAVANAQHNDELDPEELFVSACYADEGTTIKRWRPRARGRATRIRKRTSHITVIVSRLPQDQIDRLVARRRAEVIAQRARRVAGARRRGAEGDPTESRATRRSRRRGGDDAALPEEINESVDTEVIEDSDGIDETEEAPEGEGEATNDDAFEEELADAEVSGNDESEAAGEPAAATENPDAVADKESE